VRAPERAFRSVTCTNWRAHVLECGLLRVSGCLFVGHPARLLLAVFAWLCQFDSPRAQWYRYVQRTSALSPRLTGAVAFGLQSVAESSRGLLCSFKLPFFCCLTSDDVCFHPPASGLDTAEEKQIPLPQLDHLAFPSTGDEGKLTPELL